MGKPEAAVSGAMVARMDICDSTAALATVVLTAKGFPIVQFAQDAHMASATGANALSAMVVCTG
eukprot:4629084-Amphidinium_carterae.1